MPDPDARSGRERIEALLAERDIPFRAFEHEPVYTCDEAEGVVPPEVDAVQTKNLFLRDRKGRRHVLLVTHCEKEVELGRLADDLGIDRFSLASERRMREHLGVTPGAVTLLALANDDGHAVELVVDREVWEHEAIRAHPLVNSATLILARSDVERFLELTGHEPRIVPVPAKEEDGGGGG